MEVTANSNTPDPLDKASEIEMIATADAIRMVRKLAEQDQLPNEEGIYPYPDCIECGEEIPLGRLMHAANNLLCIFCQTAVEKKERR